MFSSVAPFHQRPHQVVQTARSADVHKRHDRGVGEAAEGSHLSTRKAHVPHAAPGQDLDGIVAVVVFRGGLVDLAHAAGADGVEEDVRPQHETLGLAVENAFGLETGEGALVDQVFREGGRFGARVALEEFADDGIELSAIDQSAAAEVPNEPFTCAEIAGHHIWHPSNSSRWSSFSGHPKIGQLSGLSNVFCRV